MILIHSRLTDETTIEVIQWLLNKKKEIHRINSPLEFEHLQSLIVKNKVQSVYFNGQGFIYNDLGIEDESLSLQVYNYLKKDVGLIFNYIISKARLKNIFGNNPYDSTIPVKLEQLEKAKSIGLNIPEFELVSSKKKLLELKQQWNRLICKSLADGININTNTVIIHGQKTEEITDFMIEQLDENFFPTFIQKLIVKQFEVRSFCYHRKIYSIAIFSQSNSLSHIDGRITDIEKPQRKVPIQLPEDLEEKMFILLDMLKLNYGSFDFIVTSDNKFHFLEVNPYGQYGYLSKAGNYYIEREIAQNL